MTVWQASEARQAFSDVVDAAVAGEPQFVQRRDGKEVVVVSREYFDKNRMDLKTFLLTQGVRGDEDDEFDEIIRDIIANR